MKKSDIFPSKYLRGTDIEGKEITAVIASCGLEDVGGDEDKLVIRFQGASKGIVCNSTNYDRIAYINGSDDTDHWPGTEVVIYTELASFKGGKPQPSIRVKAPLKKQNGPQLENKGRYDMLKPGQVGGYDTKTPTIQHGYDDGEQEVPF